MGQSWDCGMSPPISLNWCHVFLLEVGFISTLCLLAGISSKVPPFDSWESLNSQVSGDFWSNPATSYLLRLPVSILSEGPQGFSPFSSPNNRSGSSLPHIPCPHSHTGPSVPGHLRLLSFPPKCDWGILTCTVQLVELFEFYELNLGYSVHFFWLISTY